MRWTLLRRVEVGASLLIGALSRPTFAQGWIVPRPCGIGVIPIEGRPAVAPVAELPLDGAGSRGALLRAIAPPSVMLVPPFARGRMLGVITFAATGSRRP